MTTEKEREKDSPEITPEAKSYARMMALKYALAAEMRGLRLRGRTAYAVVQREFGLKGNRRQVYEDFLDICKEKGMWISATDTAQTTAQAINVPPITRQAIRDCLADLKFQVHKYSKEMPSLLDTSADFGFILLGSLSFGKSFSDSFDWAMQITELDKTLSYREAMSVKKKLLVGEVKKEKKDDAS